MEPISQTISFCDELRKARDFQGLPLSEISRKTKIPMEYLEALESGQLEVIPEHIRRAVISAYARTAGMNADKVLKTLEDFQGVSPKIQKGSLATDRASSERMTVGMTRAQIRTAWFASIASNRFLHWALTVLLLMVGVLLAAQWREGGQLSFGRPAQFVSIESPVSTFRASPFMKISEEIPDSLRYLIDFPLLQSTMIALDTAIVEISWGLEPSWKAEVYPHDNISFIHYSGVRIGADRFFRGIIVSENDTFQTHFTKDSLTSWLCFPDEILVDTSKSVQKADSAKG